MYKEISFQGWHISQFFKYFLDSMQYDINLLSGNSMEEIYISMPIDQKI